MSAEPGRKAPYSADIRWRVVWQRIGMDFSFRSIAKHLCISVGTVSNHLKRFEETGDVLPSKPMTSSYNRALDYNSNRSLCTSLVEKHNVNYGYGASETLVKPGTYQD